MKVKRLLSVFLILLAITGSGGDVRDSLFQVNDPGATQLVENAGFGLHEFRETVKVRLRSTAAARIQHEGTSFTQFFFLDRATQAQRILLLQRRFGESISKLFIIFGTLLI